MEITSIGRGVRDTFSLLGFRNGSALTPLSLLDNARRPFEWIANIDAENTEAPNARKVGLSYFSIIPVSCARQGRVTNLRTIRTVDEKETLLSFSEFATSEMSARGFRITMLPHLHRVEKSTSTLPGTQFCDQSRELRQFGTDVQTPLPAIPVSKIGNNTDRGDSRDPIEDPRAIDETT